MRSSIKNTLIQSPLIVFLLFILSSLAFAQDMEAVKPIIDSMQQAQEGMTLWGMIQAGGFIMVVLFLLSIVTMSLIIYNFSMINVEKLTPARFSDEVIAKLEKGETKDVENACKNTDNIISRIVLSGLAKKHKGDIFAKEAMETCARKEISNLWQSIAYLGDIATIAPLIGLLGTVLGMIQAFNVIAFQTAVVKPILLAGGVSKAMVTTAGGLIVAIPTFMVYSFFRGRVQEIMNRVESYSADIIKLIGENHVKV